jgi:two-component system, OmpR family, KDP operon response regulator KdpE
MEHKLRILMIEDDHYISKFIVASMEKDGYNVLVADNAGEGVLLFSSHHPDLIMLDLGLPDCDGMDVIRKVRAVSDVPILVVSARGQEQDKIAALDLGANDYITKPFYMGELMARVRVIERMLERSSRPGGDESFTCGGLCVEYDRRRVTVEGVDVHLTPIEYKLLCLLIANRGKVLTHSQILKQIWGYDSGDTKSIRAFMASLRRKIEKTPASPRYILTEIGVGYRFSDE